LRGGKKGRGRRASRRVSVRDSTRELIRERGAHAPLSIAGVEEEVVADGAGYVEIDLDVTDRRQLGKVLKRRREGCHRRYR
jgi:hypothetical protein